MFIWKKLIRVGLLTVTSILLTSCGLFNKNSNMVGQGVAFPPPADSPPTSESALPQPELMASIETESTAEPTSTIGPTNTSLPATAVPRPNQPAPTSPPPQILSFTADVITNHNSKTITFTWASNGADSARIYNWANGSIRFPAFWDVPTSGTLTVELSGTRRRDPHFELHIYQGQMTNPADIETVQIGWACSLDYFFEPGSNICPHSPPAYTTATSQEFEGGQMIWLEELDWIYVLYNDVIPNGGPGSDLQWERFDANWPEAFDERVTLNPPEGFYAPLGGFAKLWQENSAIRERLGWAVAPHQVYEGAWQLQPSDTDNIGDSGIFILLPDGQVARLAGFDVWGWLWSIFT